MRPTGLQDGQLRATVDLKICKRILHRIQMTRLPRQIKEILLPLHEISQAVNIRTSEMLTRILS